MKDSLHFTGYPRLMARIGNDTPIELARCAPGKRALFDYEARTMPFQLTPGVWTWWVEHTTHPKDLISPRPKISPISDERGRWRRSNKGAALSDKEKDFLEQVKDVQPDFIT